MVIRYTGDRSTSTPGALVAQDPSTGEATHARRCCFGTFPGTHRVGGRIRRRQMGRVREPVLRRPLRGRRLGTTDGLWVTNGTDEPRQLTTPCVEHPERPHARGLWAWSPTGSQLAVVEGDHLILIDPATGDRTDLGQAGGRRHLARVVTRRDPDRVRHGAGRDGGRVSERGPRLGLLGRRAQRRSHLARERDRGSTRRRRGGWDPVVARRHAHRGPLGR